MGRLGSTNGNACDFQSVCLLDWKNGVTVKVWKGHTRPVNKVSTGEEDAKVIIAVATYTARTILTGSMWW